MKSHVEFTGKRKGTPKTHIWTVISTSGSTMTAIGIIQWHGQWRKYVFSEAYEYCYFDANCLEQIAKFCREQTTAAYRRWRKQ